MWQQTEDGGIVRHPDGYLTLHNTPFQTPVVLAVFYVDPCPACPFQPKTKKRALNPQPRTENPCYEKRRKTAVYRRKQFIQRREDWDQKHEERKRTQELKCDLRKQVAITQKLRGKENIRKRRAPTPGSCVLETCPLKIKRIKAERKVDKRFRRNEPKPRRLSYPGYKSTSEAEDSLQSQISDVSGRRSRSPFTMARDDTD